MARQTLAMACSFCAERADSGYLIVGLQAPTAICGKCVKVCVSIIKQSEYERAKAEGALAEPVTADAVDPVLASSVDPSTRDEKNCNVAAGKESE